MVLPKRGFFSHETNIPVTIDTCIQRCFSLTHCYFDLVGFIVFNLKSCGINRIIFKAFIPTIRFRILAFKCGYFIANTKIIKQDVNVLY